MDQVSKFIQVSDRQGIYRTTAELATIHGLAIEVDGSGFPVTFPELQD
jgi:hypothetical protein